MECVSLNCHGVTTINSAHCGCSQNAHTQASNYWICFSLFFFVSHFAMHFTSIHNMLVSSDRKHHCLISAKWVAPIVGTYRGFNLGHYWPQMDQSFYIIFRKYNNILLFALNKYMCLIYCIFCMESEFSHILFNLNQIFIL